MSLHIDGLISFNEAKIAEYAVNTAGSTDYEAMKKALDECTSIDLITTTAQGWDPETHNLVGIEFQVVQCQDGEWVNLGAYRIPQE